MAKVTGIGGVFFKSTNDHRKLGAPTFFRARVVAVASDGGDCFEHDYRARVDTTAAQDWIRQTIEDVLGLQR